MRQEILLTVVVAISAPGCFGGCAGQTGDPGRTEMPGESEITSDQQGGCGTTCGLSVTVPAGAFMMGCNEALDTDCRDDEKPYHEVNVPSFEVDTFEVTVKAYRTCVAAGGCSSPSTSDGQCNWSLAGKDDHPVNCITWYQAGEYCAWTGKRLCSESEWEKASRGTDGRRYPWGNRTATCEFAVMDESAGRVDPGCGTGTTGAVGSRAAGASPFGAMDMSGNVYEWVQDWYHPFYDYAPDDGSACDDVGNGRVVRGGGLHCRDGGDLRSSGRSVHSAMSGGYVDVGTRCCKTP